MTKNKEKIKKEGIKIMVNYLGNVEGLATIFERTIDSSKGKFKVYNIAISKKNEDGSYANSSLDVVFSNKAIEKFNKIEGKTLNNGTVMKKVLAKGWLTVKTRGEKQFVAMFINEVAENDGIEELDPDD